MDAINVLLDFIKNVYPNFKIVITDNEGKKWKIVEHEEHQEHQEYDEHQVSNQVVVAEPDS